MNKGTGVMIFCVGCLIGSVTTWQYAKRKYEQIVQEEIASIRGNFSNKRHNTNDIPNPGADQRQTAKVKKMIKKPDISRYTDYSKFFGPEEEEVKQVKHIRVISPDEFGEIDDYEKISLTYYADQTLADENDEVIEDVENTVGMESLTHFGEYEDDSVFVRNDHLKCDYEILMDQRTYSDVIKKRPHPTEV